MYQDFINNLILKYTGAVIYSVSLTVTTTKNWFKDIYVEKAVAVEAS